jgi:hypothetical protein
MRIRGDKSGLKRNLKGQVWIETVIYTLIALTVIGLFLSYAKPKVEEIQDKSIISQSVEMMESINGILLTIVEGGPGNQRILNLGMRKGSLTIDGVNDEIFFEMDGRYTYTEPGENGVYGPIVDIGNIQATTKKIGKVNTVKLLSNYSGVYNITYQKEDQDKVISRSPTPYTISFSYKTKDASGRPIIDASII